MVTSAYRPTCQVSRRYARRRPAGREGTARCGCGRTHFRPCVTTWDRRQQASQLARMPERGLQDGVVALEPAAGRCEPGDSSPVRPCTHNCRATSLLECPPATSCRMAVSFDVFETQRPFASAARWRTSRPALRQRTLASGRRTPRRPFERAAAPRCQYGGQSPTSNSEYHCLVGRLTRYTVAS